MVTFESKVGNNSKAVCKLCNATISWGAQTDVEDK